MSLPLLSARLGKRQAALEYKWMKRATSPIPLDQMLARRVAGEPLQYILAEQPFGPLTIKTRPPVLIPRPETEHWTIRLAELLHPTATPARPLSVLDLGTGTGCIPLLLCHLLPAGSVRAYGVDISPDAVNLAAENAALCGLSAPADPSRNSFQPIQASFLDPNFPHLNLGVAPPFDLITSNPPYISWPEYVRLPPSVSHYEDPKALFGGPDGLDFYHAIAALVARNDFLNPGAVVVVEVGDGQADSVQRIFKATAQMNTEIWLDPWKKMRTVIARPGI
ncbi:S-adenosyl-L-methionine-dependent methyltransferase [Mycena rosella]|uniref:S-adenosyl-L-methionine-dependent methyltransferase n=1 Tax=Mycena rosella TaxID=1033263 RepID=A0AAD7E1C7_MYCRO|nr:S-adenosyl-L-methionine-dependent methyltransferase [Mycena rosella]